jgi:hypothetical protein
MCICGFVFPLVGCSTWLALGCWLIHLPTQLSKECLLIGEIPSYFTFLPLQFYNSSFYSLPGKGPPKGYFSFSYIGKIKGMIAIRDFDHNWGPSVHTTFMVLLLLD